MTLNYRRIQKDSFEEFHSIVRDQIWPYTQKIGIRPVGQWKVLNLPNSAAVGNTDYDEVYTLTRYASYEHYLTARDEPISMGGNGPDYQQLLNGVRAIDNFTRSQSLEFLSGPLWGAKPHYTPGTRQSFEISD